MKIVLIIIKYIFAHLICSYTYIHNLAYTICLNRATVYEKMVEILSKENDDFVVNKFPYDWLSNQ